MTAFPDQFFAQVTQVRQTASALRARVTHGQFIPSTRTERAALLAEITTLRSLVRACDAGKVPS